MNVTIVTSMPQLYKLLKIIRLFANVAVPEITLSRLIEL